VEKLGVLIGPLKLLFYLLEPPPPATNLG
jgi:hypothetical protein